MGAQTENSHKPQPPKISQLLTFLGIRSQDLVRCSSSRLWKSTTLSVSRPLSLHALFAYQFSGS